MNLILPGKIATLLCRLLFMALLLFFFSCKKNIDHNIDPNTTPPDLLTKVISSVSGFVTDENNDAVLGASVKIGTVNTTTDKYGFFEVKNVEVVKTAAVVTVTRAGYFSGIKTYIAKEGKAAFFRIKLLPKTIAGTIDAGPGGAVSLSNGLNISLPAGAVKDAVTGASYSGTVNVAAQYIDPTSDEIHKIMPGDLRGINSEGFMKGLISYGMMAVELTGAAGQLLQIADGKKATITSPVPATISSNAPSSIPLWYFDENNGLWKEEGTATKIGNSYVGEVSHFSFWNCDVPNSYVNFDCTLLVLDPASRQPLPFVLVKISLAGNPAFCAYGYTDAEGYVGGFVPDNESLIMNVYAEGNCAGGLLYSQSFSTSNINVSLGDITVNNITDETIANLSGTVTDCNNNPVNNGYIFMTRGNEYSIYPINNLGNYAFSVPMCSPNSEVILRATDTDSSTQSDDIAFNIIPGSNTLANIQACGATIFNCISNGYIYHPALPRSIINLNKTLNVISPNSVQAELGDLGGASYIALFTLDPANNITITAWPGAAGGPYTQFNTALPSTNPGYTPQWTGSSQCNNVYDPVLREYRVRYGYMGTSGWRITEEIIRVL